MSALQEERIIDKKDFLKMGGMICQHKVVMLELQSYLANMSQSTPWSN